MAHDGGCGFHICSGFSHSGGKGMPQHVVVYMRETLNSDILVQMEFSVDIYADMIKSVIQLLAQTRIKTIRHPSA